MGAPRECVPEREQEPGCDRAREVEEKKEVRAEKSGTGRFRGIVRNVMEIFRTIGVGREGADGKESAVSVLWMWREDPGGVSSFRLDWAAGSPERGAIWR